MTLHIQDFDTKAAALRSIRAEGFVPAPDNSVGESGDHGVGSRFYFVNPANAAEKRTASKVGPFWCVSNN